METVETTPTSEIVETVSQYELERGKPVPRERHSLVQANIIGQLYTYRSQYTVLSEIDIVADGKPYTPDICLYPKRPINWTTEVEQPITDPPLIAVEIMSQTQTVEQLMKKANAYLNAGAGAAWVVIPSLQTLTVMKRNAKPDTHTRGIVKDDATGVEVNLDEIFRTS